MPDDAKSRMPGKLEVWTHTPHAELIFRPLLVVLLIFSLAQFGPFAHSQTICGTQVQNPCYCPAITKGIVTRVPLGPCTSGEPGSAWTPVTPEQCGGFPPSEGCVLHVDGNLCSPSGAIAPKLLAFLKLHPFVLGSHPVYVVGCGGDLLTLPPVVSR